MAPVFADHPFPPIATPTYLGRQKSPDFQPDMFDRVASEMACVHNMMIRGLNSIYLQAPHVQQSEVPAFVRYMHEWYNLLHVHHHGEETDFFLTVERLTGEKGIMDANVAQHDAFRDGVAEFKTYIDRCSAGGEYNGNTVVKMIDLFGPVITEHLTDEIQTLLELRRFGMEKMGDMEKLFGEEGERSMKALGLVKGLTWCFLNHNMAYEEGSWAQWPPAPWIVKFLCRHVVYWFNTDMWKFASCDRYGYPKPLHAVAEEGDS